MTTNNPIYNDFAAIYDDVMDNVFSDVWIKSFNKLKTRHQLKFDSLLDVGCGTGINASRLARPDMKLYLIDQSKAMLQQAKKRCPHATIIQADMKSFKLGQPVDLAISVYGIVHYLTSLKELTLFFKQIRKNLAPHGFFCFDYFTKRHIKKYYGGGTDVLQGDNYLSIWRHQWDSKKKQSTIIVESFQKQKKLWKKHRPEWHVQKVYEWADIRTALKQAGFKKVYHYALPELTRAGSGDNKRLVLARF